MIFNASTRKIIVHSAAILTLFIMVFLPLVGFAQTPPSCPNGTYCALSTVPGFTQANQPADPSKIVTNIYGISIAVGAILAIGMIIWAGIQYATTEAISGKSEAKQHWQGAIFGLLLLLSAYLILRTINVSLVRTAVNVNTTTSQTGGGIAPNTGGGTTATVPVADQINSNGPELRQALSDIENRIEGKTAELEALEGQENYNQVAADRIRSEIQALQTQQYTARANITKNDTYVNLTSMVEQHIADFNRAVQAKDLAAMRTLEDTYQRYSNSTGDSLSQINLNSNKLFSQSEIDRMKQEMGRQVTYMNNYIQYVGNNSQGTIPTPIVFDPRRPTTSQ